MELTNKNYFSQEANMEYMSVSQYKDFKKCEVEALDKLMGVIQEEKSDALLFGGYVDAYFSNELDEYIAENPQMFNSKTGELKAPFKGINEVIKTIEEDEYLMSFLNGQKQVILTGEIAGVLFKAKIDSLLDDYIVDQKIMKDLKPLWVEELHKKAHFIEAYGYDVQGAVYQELLRQKVEKQLPFIIAATTKEEAPDKALIQIDQVYLDKALEEVKELAPRFDLIKKGLVAPIGCGNCPSCRRRKKLTRIDRYSDLIGEDL